MRDFADTLAEENPDNTYAAEFKREVRRAKSALSDARHFLRQALGLSALEARRGAERELATHARALRPSVDAAE